MSSVPEQIAELGRLLERGLLTRGQFEDQRDQLLAGAGGPAVGRGGRPARVGAYQVLGTIGEGGMGVVYRGRHRSAGIARRQGGEVAIKVLHPRLARNPDFIHRFEREATLGLELEHPGLVRAFDQIFDGDVIAFVMELVEGTLLSEHIKGRASPIRWDDSWHMFKQVLDAVTYAHSQGVIHRDLKPDNIIVGENGKLRVIDLGIAKGFGSSATQTGLAMGTVDYMAPEQHEDAKRVTVRADVYSLAMTLYEMLSGRLPWEETLDAVGVLAAKRRGRFASPSHFAPGIPSQVIRALMPALDPDPRRRYSSVEELCYALETAHFRTALSAEDEEVVRAADDPESSDMMSPEASAGPSESEQSVVEAGADDLETTQPHIVLEQTASGRFQAVRAAKEYHSPALAPAPSRADEARPKPDDLEAPGAVGVARFWRSAVDESKPELAGRLADLKARAAKRPRVRRASPGRGGEVPTAHRSPAKKRVPWDPRARQRLGVLLFVALLVGETALGIHLWLGQATQLWAAEEQNQNLEEEIEEQKLLADEVRALMATDQRLRSALTFLSVAERRRRLPALALDQIEVSKPVGLLWIESIEIGEDAFGVEAYIHSESTADELFLHRLEEGPLLSEVQITSRKRSPRQDGSYDRIRVDGTLGIPRALPKLGVVP